MKHPVVFRNLYMPTSQMYKELQVLKVEDIYQLELAKFMYQLHHNQLPKNFYHSFRKMNTIHKHENEIDKFDCLLSPPNK